MNAWSELENIVRRLRAPDGCPWDREQTHESLAPSAIEEAYETLDAIRRGDDAHLREELGDLLLQVFMHAQIASERSAFDAEAIAREVAEKLVRRHPHVFGDKPLADTGQVWAQWEEIKRAEKNASSAIDGIARGLPALLRAEKAQKKAARAGFDWADEAGVRAKLREEIEELAEADASGDPAAFADELGDLLFTLVNLARFRRIDAELQLQSATDKFIARFQRMEALLARDGLPLRGTPMETLDRYWEEAKRSAGNG